MITPLIIWLEHFIIGIISATGYAGVGLLMLFESCGIPFPSEIIMPFAGYLVGVGRFQFWLVVASGTIGNVLGSLLAYYIGKKGGRPVIERYGKYILISKHDLDIADRWFVRHGQIIVFVGRLLPVIRTYISFPAGIAKMNVKKFIIYTFLGALPWAILFTWLGIQLRKNWTAIHAQLHSLDYVVVGLLIIAVGLFITKRLRRKQNITT